MSDVVKGFRRCPFEIGNAFLDIFESAIKPLSPCPVSRRNLSAQEALTQRSGSTLSLPRCHDRRSVNKFAPERHKRLAVDLV
jgi:hypothetical protein